MVKAFWEMKPEAVAERPTWGGEFEFLMSCISMSVGLGNIWRFPFTAYENGGGAFLIPYIVVLFLVGKPMYYMEMLLGQFSSRNNVRIWALNPGFKGVGVGQWLTSLTILPYYVALTALTLFYALQSLKSELPWASCRKEWGAGCIPSGHSNATNQAMRSNGKMSSTELYYLKEVLRECDNIDDGIGLPDWRLTIATFVSWTAIFLVMVKGVKSTGKASYFLALFPYATIIALLIRAVTLPGAIDGIMYFITPQWGAIVNLRVWYSAVTQAFYSLAVGYGPIVMFSSYNKFSHNVYRDAMIVSTLDTLTSLIAGFIIFGILGNLMHSMNADDISSVVGTGGSGLAFISYPNAIAQFETCPQLFAFIFFIMLFVLGVGTSVAIQSAVVTVLVDRFQRKYWEVALGANTFGFLVGLVYVTPGGQFILTVVDKFGGTFVMLGLAISQIVGVFWIYGLENFCNDVEFMRGGKRVSIYWRLCWGITTPVIMIMVFIYACAHNDPLRYGNKELPTWAHVIGWGFLVSGLSQIPIFMLVSYHQNEKDIRRTFEPTKRWGPKLEPTKSEWLEYKEEARKIRRACENTKLKHVQYSLLGRYEAPQNTIDLETSGEDSATL